MLTPQSNATFADIADCIHTYSSFALCGHVNPDGDCLGSQVAMAALLRNLGKEVTCLLAKDSPIEENLQFLVSREHFIPACEYEGTPEVFMALDVPTRERIGDGADVLDRSSFSVTIDHHANKDTMTNLVYVDPDSPSASMLIWNLAKYVNATSEAVAFAALTGLMTDTGRFAYQNTTPESFEAAAEMVRMGAKPDYISREFFQNRTLASLKLEQRVLERMSIQEDGKFVYSYLYKRDFDELNAIKGDAEMLIDTLRSISGVTIALILKENDEGAIRGSLRAKDDSDVAQIARHYDGGGHKAAAGFTYKGTLEQALQEVPVYVKEILFA